MRVEEVRVVFFVPLDMMVMGEGALVVAAVMPGVVVVVVVVIVVVVAVVDDVGTACLCSQRCLLKRNKTRKNKTRQSRAKQSMAEHPTQTNIQMILQGKMILQGRDRVMRG